MESNGVISCRIVIAGPPGPKMLANLIDDWKRSKGILPLGGPHKEREREKVFPHIFLCVGNCLKYKGNNSGRKNISLS